MAADQFLSNIVLDAAMAADMSPREKALRDLFVTEYLVDFDSIAACLRCGFMRSFASDYAQKFLSEPYVQQQLRVMQYTRHADPDAQKQQNDFDKQRVMNGLLREAHYHGPGASHAARVSALTKLAVLYDMVPGKTTKGGEGGTTHRGGVMAVPGIANVDDWESTAVTSQAKLVQDT